MFLFCFLLSFIGHTVSGIERLHAVSNTYVSIRASVIGTFFMSTNVRKGTVTTSDIAFHGAMIMGVGEGVNYKMLPHSRTEDIVKLVSEFNVNVPGVFVFRIDRYDIEAGGCQGNTTGNILIY